MACDKCQELRIVFKIRSSSELKQSIRVAKENVADGTLSLDDIETGDWSKPFAEVSLDDKAQDDFVHYVFKCNNCGQKYKLHAETYHGRGGAWEPLESQTPTELYDFINRVILDLQSQKLNAKPLQDVQASAFTTSSEWLGELGKAIREIQKQKIEDVTLMSDLLTIMQAVHKAWPHM